MPDLGTKVEALGGVYKRYSTYLQKLGIEKFGDFLYHVPSRYVDYSLVSKIENVQPGETVTIRGKVISIKNNYARRFFTIQKAVVSDGTGEIEVTWFNQPFLVKNIKEGDPISLSGTVEKNFKLTMKTPDYEIGEDNFIHTGRVVPIYPETRGISSRWIRKQVDLALQENSINDFMPLEIKDRHGFYDLDTALRNIHFPKDLDLVSKARRRLSFDELFVLQISGLSRRREWDKNLNGIPLKLFEKEITKLIKSLPFELTGAQKKAWDEIEKDLAKQKPMNRLLEGDVGSGKTILAAIAMYLAHLNGHKSVLMAPTEILANQHYQTISKILGPFGIKVGLNTSSKKENQENFNVLIGTHAVLFGKKEIENLGIIVIDEQQRFGVGQRSMLRKKGKSPHVLTMTATPIPRTVALTLYGDLDLSILDEMPKGRIPIKTWLVPNEKRNGGYDWIKKQVKDTGSQVFIVCPFIEESETMKTVKAATKEFERLQKEIFPDYKLGLLHGKLKAKEKEEVLSDFRNKKIDILVATPVVEVGIDIPNADIMLIEAAERFGLSQLHQLRGRVGRGDRQSYCLLFTESENEITNKRLKAMEVTKSGAELAELDLRLRGPGEIYGTLQHGRRFLKIADFTDFELIQKAKAEAENIIDNISKYPLLLEKLESINTSEVSPD